MRRADRLFQIVQFLRSRRVTTARWLSEVLEVSERTIYRDIQDLMSSSVPIEGEAGIGYVIRHGYDLPPLMFTREEIAALILGARIVESWADPALANAAQFSLSKIETALPDSLKTAFDQTHLYSPMARLSVEVASVLGDLRTVIEGRQKIRIDYIRADETASTRTLWPLGLFFWGTVWTLGAWCELRQGFRNFRLDRIKALDIKQERYPDQAGRRLADLVACEKQKNT